RFSFRNAAARPVGVTFWMTAHGLVWRCRDPFWRKAAPPAVIVDGLLVMGPISLLATVPIAHHLNKRNNAQEQPRASQ
ncbi:MAG: hypothetical protein Q6L60_14115, partial [Thermostichus sp. HHBFW_bins_43]